MIKTLIERFFLRKGSTGAGQFSFEKSSEIWITAKERRDHVENFGQPKVGKNRLDDLQGG